jgi:hypothetical protein
LKEKTRNEVQKDEGRRDDVRWASRWLIWEIRQKAERQKGNLGNSVSARTPKSRDWGEGQAQGRGQARRPERLALCREQLCSFGLYIAGPVKVYARISLPPSIAE